MTERSLLFAIPGDLALQTGGYIYDRRLADGLLARGWTIHRLGLDETFPQPSDGALRAAEAAYAAIDDGTLVLTDGLAFGAMPQIAGRHSGRLCLVALVHHPLGYETGLEPDRAAALIRSEREALAAARAVLVTSETTRRSLIEAFGVHPGRIGVAPPGTDPAPVAVGSGGSDLQILAVGSIIPRKGFPALVEALAGLADLPWRLTIAGSMERAPEETARLQARIDEHGLRDRVLLAGELDAPELAKLYDTADLLVSASTYEGFGMALAEGLAHGLPIIAIAGGAVADWLDPRAAVLVPAERPGALREALAAVLTDPRLLDRLRAGAARARKALPTWDDTATSAEALLLRAASP